MLKMIPGQVGAKVQGDTKTGGYKATEKYKDRCVQIKISKYKNMLAQSYKNK